jgi:XTP/dITP diphosphohydrolase
MRHMSDKILVLATRNRGKITELKGLLLGFDINIKGLENFGPIPEAKEDCNTFEGNAYKKAFFTAKSLGVPALADDSGLVVRVLEMEDKTDRRAYFECAIVIALPAGQSMTFTGRCEGEITLEPFGNEGFGYDPIFLYPPFNRTFAQIPLEEKNMISHRGRAMAKLREEFDKVLSWLD